MYATAWIVAPLDNERLEALVFHTGAFADRRVLDVVLAVLADPSRSVAHRRAALRATVKLLAPRRWISGDEWTNPMSYSLGRVSHAWQVQGSSAISTADRIRAADVVRAASLNDPDAGIRAVAIWLRRELPLNFGDGCSSTAANQVAKPGTASICVTTPPA